MKLWKTFIHYFVPSKSNKFRPLLLRVKIASIVMLVIVLLFGISTTMQRILLTNHSPQVAAVIASALVDLANNDRVQHNEFSLTVSPLLQAAAQAKADDMAANSYFAHVSPSGRDPWYWFTQAGYNFTYGGENLAVYFTDSNTVNTAWMNSPEHRANILNQHFTQIGIATAQGVYQGHETTFVVQEFGTPASVTTAEAVTSQPLASVSPKSYVSVAIPAKNIPKVAGASISKSDLKVIVQDKNFVAVENMNASTSTTTLVAAAAGIPTPKPNPISAFILKFITSPATDLVMAYGFIGAIIVLALLFEIMSELKRPRPHRIIIGLSLIGLMVVLLFVGHAVVSGHLLIT